MHKQTLTLLSIIIFGLSACGNSSGSKPDKQESSNAYMDTEWAKHSIWDDGKAEVARYNATRVVYGQSRSFEYVYVLVKEVFNEEFTVKTDYYNRSDLYDVMKVNKFCRIPTKAYPYHYLTSVFFERNQPDRVHKLTNTSQEWCGNTAKSFIDQGSKYLFEYMSYWDGQGNGSAEITSGVWFEDQLSYTLRSLRFEDGVSFNVKLYPSQISSKATTPKASQANISITKTTAAELSGIDASLVDQPYKVTVLTKSGSQSVYWFNGSYPNLLLKMEASDGRSLALTEVERSAYWAIR